MTDDPSDDPGEEENPAIHGSESGPDDAGRESAAGTDHGAAGDTGPGSDDEAPRTTPHLADQGKPVVDSHGEDLGIVSDVDGEILYVDPDPTLAETVLSRLHWRSGDRDEVQVPAERILRIDGEVVIDVEREAASRSEP